MIAALDGLATLTRVALGARPWRARLPEGATPSLDARPDDSAPPGLAGEAFPPTPWRLRGSGALAFDLVPLARAALLLPAALEPVPVAPGFTIGTTFLGRYDASPVGPYHEAMRVPALARPRAGGAPGFFVSWIPVDSRRSVAGGLALWSVPKSFAHFDFKLPTGRCRDDDGGAAGRGPLRMTARALTPALPVTFTLPFLSVRDERVRRYRTVFAARLALAATTVEAPEGHPSAPLGPRAGGVVLESFDLLVGSTD